MTSYEWKVDGLLFLSDTFDCLRPTKNQNVRYRINIKKSSKSDLKGLSILSEYDEFSEIYFTYSDIASFEVKVLVCKKESIFKPPSNQTWWGALYSVYQNCIDEAINQMPKCSTWKNFKSLVNRREGRLVTAKEFSEFGEKFLSNFRAKLHEMYNGKIYAFLLLQNMGQEEACFKTAKAEFETVKAEKCREVIIHFAHDTTKKGSALFYNKDNWLQENGWNYVQQYYPLCVGGAGNYYYDLTMKQNPYKEAHNDENAEIVQVKLYNEAFKYMHRNRPTPFRAPTILQKCLWPQVAGKLPNHISNDLNTAEETINAIDKAIRALEKQEELYVRCEILIRIQWAQPNCLKRASLLAMKFFDTTLGSEDNLISIEVDAIREHIRKWMWPALRTLEQFATEAKSANQRNELVLYSIDQIESAVASEILICFFLYGVSAGRGHPGDYCNVLKLTQHWFREADFLPAIIGNGLLHITDDTLPLMIYKIMDEKKENFKKFDDLRHNVLGFKCTDIFDLISRRVLKPNDLLDIGKYLASCVVYSSALGNTDRVKLKNFNFLSIELQETHTKSNRILNGIKLASVSEFLNEFEQQAITRRYHSKERLDMALYFVVRSCLLNRLNDFELVKESFAKCLESKLVHEKTYLLTRMDEAAILVLPDIYKLVQLTNFPLNGVLRNQILFNAIFKIYKSAYRKRYSSAEPQVFKVALEEIFDTSLQIGIDIQAAGGILNMEELFERLEKRSTET